MSEKLSLDEIRRYWTDQVGRHGASPAASWSDLRVIELEIKEIVARLKDGDTVLDVGCANGFSTVEIAAQRSVRIKGIDYIPEMIRHARERSTRIRASLRGSVSFGVGDVTALDEPDASYDTAVVIRVIINLGGWEQQVRGLRECARVLKPGGRFLLSEATVQGWQRLNVFRAEWGLPAIPVPPFNHYLDEDQVVQALSPDLELIELVNFASTYYVGTRVLKPLFKSLGADVDVADPAMEWNRWFAQLPQCGDYGTQKLFVFEKRG